MKRLVLAAALLLSACTTTPVTETTTGSQGTAPVSSIQGEVASSVAGIGLRLGESYQAATLTPPAPGNGGTVNPLAPITFVLPLPASLPDPQLSRFYELFRPAGCAQAVTGNFYARLHLVSALSTPEGQVALSVTQQQTSAGATSSQVLYLYSDRATYLRGTVSCPVSGRPAPEVTGFELNVVAGWNRVLLVKVAADQGAGRLYATVPRSAATQAGERWTVQ